VRLAERHGAEGIAAVTVSIGALSGVDPDALEMAFPLAAAETALAGTRLIIESVPAALTCRRCGAEWSSPDPFCLCRACGSSEVDVTAGRELHIRSLELVLPEEMGSGR
jgi:hydrogenase nickel incorporation protein HypA/HybF